MIGSEYVMPDPDRDDKLDRKDELDEAVDTFIEATDADLKKHDPFNTFLGICTIGSLLVIFGALIYGQTQ